MQPAQRLPDCWGRYATGKPPEAHPLCYVSCYVRGRSVASVHRAFLQQNAPSNQSGFFSEGMRSCQCVLQTMR